MKKNTTKTQRNDFENKKRYMLWGEEIEKSKNLFLALSEYIDFLERVLEYKEDLYEKYLIKQKIRELNEEKRKYNIFNDVQSSNLGLDTEEVPTPALENSSFGRVQRMRTEGAKKTSLENSCLSLVKNKNNI